MNEVFFFEELLQSEDDAITIVNTEKKVIYWNMAAEQTYQIAKEQIINHPITDFFSHDDLMVMKVLRTMKPVKNAYHRPRKDKHVVVNTSPVFNQENSLIGVISIERDVTHIVKLNDNLESTSQELQELKQKMRPASSGSPFAKLVGESQALHQMIRLASKTADTDATTLILGESGTGKEVCARAIHDASNRKNAPFIPVNCGAIPQALFESELFGYESGSFTGAEKGGKAGKIEMADGGTIFLDEVGELPLDMQVKLLRVLQENRIYRIGDSRGKQIDVRFIAATNQDLDKLMQENKFRSDLFYRLNVIQLTMPPLRDRKKDIEILAETFLKQFALKYQASIPKLPAETMEVLRQYHWPGNIREIRNLMERVIILHEGATLTKQDMLSFLPVSFSTPPLAHPESLPLEKESMEKTSIEQALELCNGNKSKAAKQLGISRVTLYQKIKKYNLSE
ncbi:sigma-54 interaction domain-containing protein [Oceanobacillus neutriphilus]|uniref:Sigma-54-dependent Fis family transcriptional regulator n=1 Tax=Oceanobacillus neutriphilus TaxID=531815 RepID=A0ABQ2NT68_9BACI|nr:sigma 54-interacting transcriptional regulator [Oceanobacillus neutriphilus]GGP09640.1 sigma-54-dependent Fis family transcriptional regulator [Oceanobacillus neutriphilus]